MKASGQRVWFARIAVALAAASVLSLMSARSSAGARSAAPQAAGATPVPARLAGTGWRLERVLYSDDKEVRPPANARPGSYTLVFLPNGRVAGRGDANRFTGRVTVSGDRLTFGSLASTRAMSAPGSAEADYLKALSQAASYRLDGDLLRVMLKADSGTMTFARDRSAKAAAGTAVGRVVRIDSGRVAGAVSGDVLVFKGVPFAAPPVGKNRWRAPQPVKPWAGIRKATQYGPDPPQKPASVDAAAPPGVARSEDCLYLNVWRPAKSTPGETLPVLVWIYGGAFVNGGASPAENEGSAFARQGLVVVSFNYRLGRLGFFSHPALEVAKEGPVGNFGYMDQIAALEWVRRNIAAFGGDPGRVTIMGESAGGMSVVQLLTSPVTKGLFHRAVVLSGGGRGVLGGYPLRGGTAEKPSADQFGLNFARSVGITGTGPDALAKLRALPAEKVVGDLNMLALVRTFSQPLATQTYGRGPFVDGAIVTDTPEALFRAGKAAKVPLLIGTTNNDLPALFPPKDNPFSYFGADAERARAAYNPDGKADPMRVYLTIGVDMTMQEPARFAARRMTAAGKPVWLYRFGYVAESLRPKVTTTEHSTELPFVFDTVAARYGSAVTRKDRRAARTTNRYFANFARFGDPNGPGLPAWPKYDPSRSDLMLFTLDDGPVVRPDPWKTRLDLVERAANK